MDVFEITPIALTACTSALADLSTEDLARPTPCADFTVADVVAHLQLAMTRLAGLAGVTLEAGAAPLSDLADAALDAWRTRGLDGTVDLRGPLPAHLAAEIIPLELVVHGSDIATATGRPFEVDAAVVGYLLGAARAIVPDRRGKAFAAEVRAPSDATPLQQLIAFTGRSLG